MVFVAVQKLSIDSLRDSLPVDVLRGSFVTHSFLPDGGRNDCVTNEPQRTSAGRLSQRRPIAEAKKCRF